MKRRTFMKSSSLTSVSSLFVASLVDSSTTSAQGAAIIEYIEAGHMLHHVEEMTHVYLECRQGRGEGVLCWHGEFVCLLNGLAHGCGDGCVEDSSASYTCYGMN
jgi:hypothetical protein